MNLTLRHGRSRSGPPEKRTERLISFLGAFCLFLSTIEYMIPKPLPFMRIGLANLPLLLGLDLLSPGAFALLALIKVLGQALITGTLFSYVFLFSLAGTAASGAVMYLLRNTLGPEKSGFTGISVAGALVSNAVQMLLACLFMFGSGAKLIVPPFLVMGIVTGATLGLFCETFAARSLWFKRQLGGLGPEAASGTANAGQESAAAAGPGPYHGHGSAAAGGEISRRRHAFRNRFRPGDLCAAALIMAAAFLCNPSPFLRTLQFLLFWLFAYLSGKRLRPLITLLAIFGIVIFNLFPPYGRVLAELGSLRITGGALLTGFRKALTLEGLILLSGAAIRPDLHLPGPLGSLVAESLKLFERIGPLGNGGKRGTGLIAGIDRLMLELSAEQETIRGRNPPAAGVPESEASAGPAPVLPGRLALCAAVLATAALTAAGFLCA
ncbi:MAG: Gx transporter family protein [Treponema sp.]|jgi:heptaprenyl diphosphate synthase|nr:Gx transporter family protein [Treponema sp.]